MQLTTYLNFNGNCEAAFKFYAETLGGKITLMMTQGESPMGDKVPEPMKDKIMHATLEVRGGSVLMGADHPQGKHVQPAGFCVPECQTPQAEACATSRRKKCGRAQRAAVHSFPCRSPIERMAIPFASSASIPPRRVPPGTA